MLESGENYLETILMLEQKKGNVRSVDVAGELGITKPSVSRAMSILRAQEYIAFSDAGHIVFTKKGRAKAEAIYERHQIITQFLVQTLCVSEEIAAKDACRFEHDISEETFVKMKEIVHEQ